METTAVASVLGGGDILSTILHYAISSTTEMLPITLTCRHWNDIINVNPESSRSIWRSICSVQSPEILRIYHLCEESRTCPNIPGGGYKILLNRSLTSCFMPQGCNKRFQKSLELVFKREGIVAFSNCCTACTDSYSSCSGFELREKGIQFFKFFLNGGNYRGSMFEPYYFYCAYVAYSDFEYVLENWEVECDIIRRWCAVMEVEGYNIEKPDSEKTCILVRFARPLILEEEYFSSDYDDEDGFEDFYDFDGEDEEDIDVEAEDEDDFRALTR